MAKHRLALAALVFGGVGFAALGQPAPPYNRGQPQNGIPGQMAPAAVGRGGSSVPGPDVMPAFFSDVATPFDRPVKCIEDGPIFGGAPETGRGVGPGGNSPHEEVTGGPASLQHAQVEAQEMTQMPAGIGFIGGAGMKPKPPGRAPRASGSPGRGGQADQAAPPAAPPPPPGVLDKPGITLIRSLVAAGATGG
jgi:hypothetical protein